MYRQVEGNLITLAQQGYFDVIAHGCNCYCVMGGGIAPQMDRAFGCNNPRKYPLEHQDYAGDLGKLGNIQFYSYYVRVNGKRKRLDVVNAYTQYGFGRNHKGGSVAPVDYEAVSMVMRKMNHTFKGMHIGLPMIGAGLAGGDWIRIRRIIKRELKQCDVTVVIYKP